MTKNFHGKQKGPYKVQKLFIAEFAENCVLSDKTVMLCSRPYRGCK